MYDRVIIYVGHAFLLWATEYKSAGTTDGAGRAHAAHVVLNEYMARVTDQHLDIDPQGKVQMTITACTEDGEVFQQTNGRRWHQVDVERTPHVDIVDAIEKSEEVYRFGMLAHVDKSGQAMIPSGTELCLYHGDYYLPEEGCRACNTTRRPKLKTDDDPEVEHDQCPFCDQLRRQDDTEMQDAHLRRMHQYELGLLGVEFSASSRKRRFSEFERQAEPAA